MVGVGGWVGGVENCTIRLNSAPLSLSWGLTELGNIILKHVGKFGVKFVGQILNIH